MIKQLDMGKFEEYISQFPVYGTVFAEGNSGKGKGTARSCSQECEHLALPGSLRL